MTRTGDALIEFQDGTSVDVLFWFGPGYMVQWVNFRVVNEKREDDTHWVKVEHTADTDDAKFWVPRWRIRKPEMAHSLTRQEG